MKKDYHATSREVIFELVFLLLSQLITLLLILHSFWCVLLLMYSKNLLAIV